MCAASRGSALRQSLDWLQAGGGSFTHPPMSKIKLGELAQVGWGWWRNRQFCNKPPKHRQQERNIYRHCFPQYPKIYACIIMYQLMPECCDIRPRNFWMTLAVLFRHIIGGLAQYDKIQYYRTCQSVIEKEIIPRRVRSLLFYALKSLQHMQYSLLVAITIPGIVVHTATASLHTRAANLGSRGNTVFIVSSTRRSSTPDNSRSNPEYSRRPIGPLNLTSISTSLSGRSSLRAHEPKTQSFSALCFLAIAYISSRFARISSSIHITV